VINHVSIGVRHIPAAKRFYDAVFRPLGYRCVSKGQKSLSYGEDQETFLVYRVKLPVSRRKGSGLHFCFDAPTRASVNKFYAAAMKHGGTDNGAPGLREDYGDNYYAAFVIDPDGYRIEAYCDKAR
jgi:catechol 2,3-dioxygenase-like lactoylglutathione lyase family enzyme